MKRAAAGAAGAPGFEPAPTPAPTLKTAKAAGLAQLVLWEPTPGSPGSLAGSVACYLAMLTGERSASEHTVRAYRRELGAFTAFLHGELAVRAPQAITHTHVQEYLHVLYDRKLQKSSIARALAAVRSWCKWLAREGVLPHNPAALVSTPRLPRRLPRVPTAAELIAAMDAPATTKMAAWPERDALILELLYGCGLRNAELAALDLGAIDAASELLRVRGKGRKERLVPFGQSVAQALLRYLPGRAALLVEAGLKVSVKPKTQVKPQAGSQAGSQVRSSPARQVSLSTLLADGGPLLVPVQAAAHASRAQRAGTRGVPRLTTRSVGRILKAMAVAGGLPAETHPHTMRHAFGTHLLESGADLRAIQELLGHQRLSTTQRYTQLTDTHVAAVYERTHPRAR